MANIQEKISALCPAATFDETGELLLVNVPDENWHALAKALKEQLVKAGCPERENLPFQKEILEKKLPYTIGGGIGQSRICMFFLKKAHIGEVQASIWPEDVLEEAEKKGLNIL